MDIVFAGYIALSETIDIFKKKREEILGKYPAWIECSLSDCENAIPLPEIVREAVPEDIIYECTQDGIYRDLWRFGELLGKGFEIDFLKLPIRQETIEICECLGHNPYELSSEGCFLIGSCRGVELANELLRKSIYAEVVGFTTENKARILRRRDNISYLNKPR